MCCAADVRFRRNYVDTCVARSDAADIARRFLEAFYSLTGRIRQTDPPKHPFHLFNVKDDLVHA